MNEGETDRLRTLLVALAVASVAVIAAGAVVGSVTPDPAVGDTDSAHRNPDTVTQGADLGGLESRLTDQIVSRARLDDADMSQRGIEQTRSEVTGPRYSVLVSQYATIARVSGQENKSRAFRRTYEHQVEYVTAVERYWERYERYQEVRRLEANGTDPADIPVGPDNRTVEDPSRYLAHRVEYQWSQANWSKGRLVESYRDTGEVMDANFSASTAKLNRTQANLTATQREIREREFVVTTLSARPDEATISFRDPLVVEGRLTAANGTVVADRTVRMGLDNRSVRTRTNDTGHFRLVYRPTQLPTDTEAVRVEFVPNNATTYARSAKRIEVDVERDEVGIAVDAGPSGVSYNETLRVTGRVGTDEAGAAAVPFVVTVDGRILARNETDADGRIDVQTALPPDVAVGERRVRVRTLTGGRALVSTEGAATVDVGETPTTLSTSVRKTGGTGRALRVSGRLVTNDESPVADQQVRIEINGSVAGVAQTDAEGRFERVVEVPQRVVDGGLLGDTSLVGIRTVYRDGGTNLGPARSLQPMVIGSGSSTVLIAGGAGVVAVVGLVVLYWRWSNRWTGSVDVDPESVTDRGDGGDEAAPDPASLFAYARERLSAGDPGRAVWAGYAATRRRIAERIDRAPAGTHWEFYRACREADLDEERLEGLRWATELYERAAFTPESVSAETAERALDRMGGLAGDGDREGGETAGD